MLQFFIQSTPPHQPALSSPSLTISNAAFTRAHNNSATLGLHIYKCILQSGPQAQTREQGLRPVSSKKVPMRRIGMLYEMQSGQHNLRISVRLHHCHCWYRFMQADYYFGCSKIRRPPVKFYSSSCTELLLQREPQLVLGLQRMYHRLVEVSAWNGPPLALVDGQPLTHDILSALDILDPDPGSVDDRDLFDASFEDVTPDCVVGNSRSTQPTELTHLTEDVWFAAQPTINEPEPTLRRSASVTDTSTSFESCNTHPTNVPLSPSRNPDRALQPHESSTLNSELTHLPDKTGPAEQITHCFRTLYDPMFAILYHSADPVFRTLDDPMFATLAHES